MITHTSVCVFIVPLKTVGACVSDLIPCLQFLPCAPSSCRSAPQSTSQRPPGSSAGQSNLPPGASVRRTGSSHINLWLLPPLPLISSCLQASGDGRWEKLPELGLWSLGQPWPGLQEHSWPRAATVPGLRRWSPPPSCSSVGLAAPTTRSHAQTRTAHP